jgi:hypothetical protein
MVERKRARWRHRIIRSLAFAAIAFIAQGCDQPEEDQLTLLGDGGCRTADGGEGEFTPFKVASWDECAAQCSGENGTCTALEYNANNGDCEVHQQPITSVAAVDGVQCHVAK